MRRKLHRRDLTELQECKRVFDNVWYLFIALATAALLIPWYLKLNPLDISPAVTALIATTVVQAILNGWARTITSAARLQTLATLAQMTGLIGMGVVWHLMGGLQNPTFALFVIAPMLVGPLVLSVWQQAVVLSLSGALLFSALMLSPTVNSFVDERYGVQLLHPGFIPLSIPRSRVVFPEVTTTPPFDILMLVNLAIAGWALNAASAAVTKLLSRNLHRHRTLQEEAARAGQLADDLIVEAPSPEVLVAPNSGKIIQSSRRFIENFQCSGTTDGAFLLDLIDFRYPAVIKRLMREGGEDLQAAQLNGRQVNLRIRASIISRTGAPVSRMTIEPSEEQCWRGALDAMDDPVVAIDCEGRICFGNRAAVEVLGPFEPSQALADQDLGFDSDAARWWDIAPLDSARRLITARGRSYMATIRRTRVAVGVGTMTYVFLQARSQAHAAA